MIWRLNDSWPILYWSVIDYYLQPKMAYYYIRRAYNPVLVSFEQTPDRIAVWVTNDSPETVSGALTVQHRTFKGETQGQVQANISLGPGQSKRCLDLTDLGPIVKRKAFLQADFLDEQSPCLLISERYLHLPQTRLSVQRRGSSLELSAEHFAYQVALSAEDTMGALFEDNYFHLAPGHKKTIELIDTKGAQQISIQALNSEPVLINMN
jgi:beta-mannosidase